ncbi:MAG: PD-(D/E)XK nuclease family protein, partial [Ktedonobacterales bacterium]
MTATLSHSQMETWGQCRRRWYLEKVQRAPRAPASALLLGDAFHAALEADGRAACAGAERLSLEQLLTIGQEALGQRLATDDPERLLTDDDELSVALRLVAMLRAYVATVQAAYQ